VSNTSAFPFVDTNVLLRHLLNDLPDQSPSAQTLFAELETGARDAQVTGTIVFECVFVLQTHYGVPREAIRKRLLPILAFEHLMVPDREVYPAVFDLYVARKGLSFADCYHAVLARHLGTGIISFDRGFDRIPGLTRIEPQAPNR